MAFKDLVWVLTKMEGGKVQVDVAQMSEVLSRLKHVFKIIPADVIRILVK